MSLTTLIISVALFIVIVDAAVLFLARNKPYPALWVAGANVGITVLGQATMVVMIATH